MTRAFLAIVVAAVAAGSGLFAQSAPGGAAPFVPVTSQMLLNPSPDDWLMFSRTYDAQRRHGSIVLPGVPAPSGCRSLHPGYPASAAPRPGTTAGEGPSPLGDSRRRSYGRSKEAIRDEAP